MNRLKEEGQWAKGKLCPLSAACFLSTDLLSHLNITWESLNSEVQTAKAKRLSEAEALADFSAHVTTLTSWLGEKREVLEAARLKLDRFSSKSIGTYAEELSKQKSQLPLVEIAIENVTASLKKKEKMVSTVSDLLNSLNVSCVSGLLFESSDKYGFGNLIIKNVICCRRRIMILTYCKRSSKSSGP